MNKQEIKTAAAMIATGALKAADDAAEVAIERLSGIEVMASDRSNDLILNICHGVARRFESRLINGILKRKESEQ